MPSALLVLEGLTALHSSQNKGSAFVAPLIPAMAVCAAWAFARLPGRPRQLLTAATVAVVVVNVVVSADLGTWLARTRHLDVPELGLLPVTSGRGALQGYEADTGTVVLTATQPVSRKEGVAWVAASADVAARLRAHDGPIVVTAFGFRHRLVNVNSVQFEELSAGEPPLPLDQVAPLVTTDTADGYAAWLSEGGDGGRGLQPAHRHRQLLRDRAPGDPRLHGGGCPAGGVRRRRRSGRCPTSGWCRSGGGRPSAP